ncbi:hypothetical protein OXX80_002477 [Metschnikowia pulcherrima]
MAQQKKVDLNKPLDATEEAKIRRTPLEPASATAALTLHGDYYRQVQSKTNHAIVWHPITQVYLLVVFVVATVYVFRELVDVSDSISEFFSLLKYHKYVLTKYFPAMIFAAGTVGLVSFTITDEFRVISDKLASDAYMAQIFRFPLRVYANAQPTDANTKFVEAASQSTDLVEYRNSPIAIVTVVPLPDMSTTDTFHAKITGLHVRKAYRTAGVEKDLLEFAKEKARLLCNRYVSDNNIHTNNIRIVLAAEAYSVDKSLTSLYAEEGFSVKGTSTKLDPFALEATKTFFFVIPAGALLRLFGITRISYELELDNTVDLVTGSTAVKKNETSAKRRA